LIFLFSALLDLAAESADRAAQPLPDSAQAAGAKDNQYDDQYNDQFRQTQLWHLDLLNN
jgi:hypothetical protein